MLSSSGDAVILACSVDFRKMMKGFNEEEPIEQSRHSAQVERVCKGCKEDVVTEQSMEIQDLMRRKVY